MFRRKYLSSLPIALIVTFGSLASAQTSQPPNLPGTISTVATPNYTLNLPAGVAVDQQNNVYISDTDNNRILKVNQQSGAASLFAGTGTAGHTGDGGPAASATLNAPEAIAVAANGDLYITEFGNQDVRKVTAATGVITTVVTGLNNPNGVAYDDAGQNLYVADYGTVSPNTAGSIIKVDSNGTKTTLSTGQTLQHPSTVAYANGYVYLIDNAAGLAEKVNVSTQATTSISTGLSNPWGIAVDPAGDVYISLYGDRSHSVGGQVVMVNTSGSTVTIAGNGSYAYAGDGGSAPNASMKDSVTDIAIGPDGNLYIDDGADNAIRKVTFPAGSTTPPVNNIPGCTVISFGAGPNPIYTNTTYGITSILANVTCPYEIHVGSPNGALFATANGYSSTLTGQWVSDGMQFYLQQAGNTTSAGTLALPLTVHLAAGNPGLACLATAFSASPNPIVTSNQYGQTTITAVTNCSFDIHIGSPSGAMFKQGRGYAALQTGQWVTDGMTMYLQPHGDTNPSDTLSTLKLVLQTPPSGCTVNSFTANPNPIKTTSTKGQTTISADATCDYDVRIGSPDGGSLQSGNPNTGLMGSGSGQTSFASGNWVTNGMTFYLQQKGSTSASGTLATLTANLILPDQQVPSCTISQFNASNNPIIAAGGSGQTTVNVNAACNWDLRLNDSAGSLLASGKGSGSATATNVTNGTKFYLQPQNDTYYGDNLAILNATVAPQAPSGCTVLVFTATPVESDSSFGYSTISADATCPYDIRIDSPNGNLFGSGSGFTSANTGNWVIFGQQFFLQKQGDTTSAGTLAVQSAIVLPNINRQ